MLLTQKTKKPKNKMKESVKAVLGTLKNSPIGAIAGGIGGFYLAKKKFGVTNKFGLVAIAVVSALIGSTVEYKVKASFTKPALSAKK